MIRTPAGLVDQAASDAPHQQTVVDGKLDDSIQVGFPLVQQCVELQSAFRTDYNLKSKVLHTCGYLLSLNDSPGESVQEESVLALGLVQVGVDHVHDQVVGDQFAGIHDLLQLGSQLRTG